MLSRGGSVLAPPGVVMVAPPEVPRNAEGAQSEGRAKEIVKERDQEQYKGRNPDKDPGRSRR